MVTGLEFVLSLILPPQERKLHFSSFSNHINHNLFTKPVSQWCLGHLFFRPWARIAIYNSNSILKVTLPKEIFHLPLIKGP